MLRQIGSSNIADKQGIASNNSMILAVFIDDKVAGTLKRMSRSMKYFYGHPTHRKLLPVFGDYCFKSGFGRGTVNNLSTGFGG